MITVLHRGGYAQMITILNRGEGSLGTPKSNYVICARPLNTFFNFPISSTMVIPKDWWSSLFNCYKWPICTLKLIQKRLKSKIDPKMAQIRNCPRCLQKWWNHNFEVYYIIFGQYLKLENGLRKIWFCHHFHGAPSGLKIPYLIPKKCHF